jgi:hypothetical protein
VPSRCQHPRGSATGRVLAPRRTTGATSRSSPSSHWSSARAERAIDERATAAERTAAEKAREAAERAAHAEQAAEARAREASERAARAEQAAEKRALAAEARARADAGSREVERETRERAARPARPVEHYDDLAAEEVIALLASLEPGDLQTLREYERDHANRSRVLSAIDSVLARGGSRV